jgi:hypothetical protein
MAPDRVYDKGISPGWLNPSHHSFPFNPCVNEDELCQPLPRRWSYLRDKLTTSRPRPGSPLAPCEHWLPCLPVSAQRIRQNDAGFSPLAAFPKWVDPPSHGGLFSSASSLAPSFLTPAQMAAMVAPKRNFDNSISNITNMPARHSWNDFASERSLRLARDEQGRTGCEVL